MASNYTFPEYPKVKIEYHIITPHGRCAMIYTDRNRAEEHSPLHPGWKVIKVTTTMFDITPKTAEEIDYCIDHEWSLGDYIRYINRDRDEPLLCEDYDHWYSMGIHSARELADYIDCEHARNLESV